MTETVRPRIVLAGGSGFVGRSLGNHLTKLDCDVVVLTRWPRPDSPGIRYAYWNGRTLDSWAGEVDGATAIVNLAGRSVNCRYNAKNRKEILESRVDSTKILGEAIGQSKQPPFVWLNMSTATIYKHTFDREMDEETGVIEATAEAKDAFSIEVATAWERTSIEAYTPRTRKVAMRTAMVFGAGGGGVYRTLRSLTRWGLGGTIAAGSQYISWIHEEDLGRAVEFLIDNDKLSGPVNLASPNPITQKEMMSIIRHQLGMPIGLPATRRMLETAAFIHRTEAELIIKSRRVVPKRLEASGFAFRYPRMDEAVKEIEERIHGKRPDP